MLTSHVCAGGVIVPPEKQVTHPVHTSADERLAEAVMAEVEGLQGFSLPAIARVVLSKQLADARVPDQPHGVACKALKVTDSCHSGSLMSHSDL